MILRVLAASEPTPGACHPERSEGSAFKASLPQYHPTAQPGHPGRSLHLRSEGSLFAIRVLLCAVSALFSASSPSLHAQTTSYAPDWCKNLPRPAYKSLERVLPNEPWFEVYKVAPATFALYEPHQSEETISYLIVGARQALLFDTGMGIADIRAAVRRLTSRPIVVLNSHTHDDHVGGNWQFEFIYDMDTAFTRATAKGSRNDAQAEIAPGEICGELPKTFNPKTYATKPWRISLFIHDGFKINLGGRTLEVIATPGHTPDAICLLDRANGLLFTGDTYYPGTIWLYRPETDIHAYMASVKKLASLAPGIELVLGAHNIPVAQPGVLAQLNQAINDVYFGKAQPKPLNSQDCDAAGCRVIYAVNGISFLMRRWIVLPSETPKGWFGDVR